MKLGSFQLNGRSRFGVFVEGGIIDLTGRLGTEIGSLRQLIAANAFDQAREIVEKSRPGIELSQITFDIPIPDVEKILCIGVNYANRNAEYKDNSDLPKYPSVFPRFPGSFVGHQQNLIQPLESQQLDYEGEIVIVVGKTGRRIRPEEADSYIAGLTLMNEGTIRDWVRHGKFNVTQGKNFERTGSIGPWMVTADALPGYGDLRVTTRVNGEVRQDDTTANLMFDFRYLLAYLSTFTTLKPGDLIATGTPIGTGARREPPVYLQPGDTVEVEGSGIGLLSNVVAAEG